MVPGVKYIIRLSFNISFGIKLTRKVPKFYKLKFQRHRVVTSNLLKLTIKVMLTKISAMNLNG